MDSLCTGSWVLELFLTLFVHFPIDFGKPRYGNPKETNYFTESEDWPVFTASILKILPLWISKKGTPQTKLKPTYTQGLNQISHC